MKIIEAKMEKELRNGVNRRCNCDTANLGKAVDAAQQQLIAIRRLRDSGKMDSLPEKLRDAARLREENPELRSASWRLWRSATEQASDESSECES